MGVDKVIQPKQGTFSYQLLIGQIALKPKRSKDVLSYHQPSELLQFQKENTNKRAALHVPWSRKFEWTLSTCDISSDCTVSVLSDCLALQPLSYHVKRLLLERAGILSRKAADCSEKRCAKYCPYSRLGI